MGDFRKKISCGLILCEKILARKLLINLAQKIPLDTEKKNIFHCV